MPVFSQAPLLVLGYRWSHNSPTYQRTVPQTSIEPIPFQNLSSKVAGLEVQATNWFQFNQFWHTFAAIDASRSVAVFYFDCFTVNTYGPFSWNLKPFCWHLFKLTSNKCWLVLQVPSTTTVDDDAPQIANRKTNFSKKKTNLTKFSLVNSGTLFVSINASCSLVFHQ